jgi:integrase
VTTAKKHYGIREHHGKYQVRYYGPDGKRRSQSFQRLTDAKAFKADTETDKRRRVWKDPAQGRERLEAVYSRLVARARKTGKITERTLLEWDQIWRQHIHPELGSRPVASITHDDCQALVDSASTPWRARDVRKVLHRILASAHLDPNPAAKLDVPALEWKRPRVLTMAEVEALAEAIESRYSALVVVGAFGALRWSELVGLRVSDVDFIRGRIRVNRKIVESGRMFEGEPKNKGSKRWVTFPESVTLQLSEHVRHHVMGDVLFPGPDGGPIRRKTFHRAWVRAAAAAGLGGFQVRNLRHSGATWALESGISPVLVAFRLGHRSTRMIEAHYADLIEPMDAAIAKELEHSRRNGDQLGTKSRAASGTSGPVTR